MSYRDSHSSKGYGQQYDLMYKSDYYAAQWDEIEAPHLKRVLAKIRESGKDRHLDFACGTGRILEVCESYFSDTTGVDISSEMATRAVELCTSSKVIFPRDITIEPLDQTFEVITSFRFFLNAEPTLRKAVLSEFSKMQTSGSFLVINVHVNSRSILGYLYRLRNALMRKKIANTMSEETIRQELNDADYDVEEVCHYSFWPRLGPYWPKAQARMLISFEKIQRKMPILPYFMSQSFMLVCKKR